jgi:hypothetical protein
MNLKKDSTKIHHQILKSITIRCKSLTIQFKLKTMIITQSLNIKSKLQILMKAKIIIMLVWDQKRFHNLLIIKLIILTNNLELKKRKLLLKLFHFRILKRILIKVIWINTMILSFICMIKLPTIANLLTIMTQEEALEE